MLARPELPTNFVAYLGEVIPDDKIPMVGGDWILPNWRTKSCVIVKGGQLECEDCPPGYGASAISPQFRCRRIPTEPWEASHREPFNPFLQSQKQRDNPDWPDTAYPGYNEDPQGLPKQYDSEGFPIDRKGNLVVCPEGEAFFVDDPQAGCKPLSNGSTTSGSNSTPVDNNPPVTTIDPSQLAKLNKNPGTLSFPGKLASSTDVSSSEEASASTEDASKKKSSWIPWAVGLVAVGTAIGGYAYYKNHS